MSQIMCLVCGSMFEAKRKDAKACSARCRQRRKRGKPYAIIQPVKCGQDEAMRRLLSMPLELPPCKIKDCRFPPYHNGYCMQHWRSEEK